MRVSSHPWMQVVLGPYGFVALGLAVVTLLLLCYRAITQWETSARLLADRRAQTAVDLLVTAFTRDMRGVQVNVLAPARLDEPSDVHNRVMSGFARYPYPEVFVVWQNPETPGSMLFYSRSGRRPSWLPSASTRHLPVVTSTAPDVAALLATGLAGDAARHRRFSIADIRIGGTPYQVVMLLSYRDPYREHIAGAFGFLVNLDWVRRHYFQDLTTQVGRIAGISDGIALGVHDERGVAVVPTSRPAGSGVVSTRPFPIAFYDPIVAGVDSAAKTGSLAWRAEAHVSGEPSLIAATAGARGTLGIALAAGVLLVATYGVIVQATKETNRLADMRAAFVATVTHELKTPLATIRMVGETFASGEQATLEMSQRFARVSVNEAKRLTRLIDNLLAYARVTDVTELYQFEALAPATLVDEVLEEFGPQLTNGGFQVERDVPPGLPSAWADRTSIRLMMSNLVDNAVRYAGTARRLALRARAGRDAITIEIEDGGIGIPEAELPEVTRRFFRGHSAGPGGSGLGLAIVERIVSDHGGTLAIRSTVGSGTTVTVTLPLAGDRA